MNKITVRSYNRTSDGHCHHYHQILLPIKGYIDLKLDGEAITACYGDCVVILAGCFHEFYAHEDFRFLVIDTDILPNLIYESGSGLRILDEATQQYLVFVEKQMVHHIEDEVEVIVADERGIWLDETSEVELKEDWYCTVVLAEPMSKANYPDISKPN